MRKNHNAPAQPYLYLNGGMLWRCFDGMPQAHINHPPTNQFGKNDYRLPRGLDAQLDPGTKALNVLSYR
jgi:hypothetical protein